MIWLYLLLKMAIPKQEESLLSSYIFFVFQVTKENI